MPASTLLQPRRWAVVVAAWLLGAGAALALHAGEIDSPAAPSAQRNHDEFERTRREQTLLRAESTVRLLRLLEASPDREGPGP